MRYPILNGPAALLAMALAFAPGTSGAEYREGDVKDGGKVAGKVTFHGKLPDDAVENYPVSGKWPGCGTGYRKVVTVDVKDGALRGAFVLLDGITQGKKWPQRPSATLEQKGCVFIPMDQIVRSGAPLTIRNSDSGVLHTVNLREISEVSPGRDVQRMLFNVAQPDVGQLEKKVKPRNSPFITIGCEIHNFMVAHILAPEHPYAAMVGPDGSFALDDVPPGTVQVVAWHPKLGKKRMTVTVPPRGTAVANFDFGP